jgi:hypothetical protein
MNYLRGLLSVEEDIFSAVAVELIHPYGLSLAEGVELSFEVEMGGVKEYHLHLQFTKGDSTVGFDFDVLLQAEDVIDEISLSPRTVFIAGPEAILAGAMAKTLSALQIRYLWETKEVECIATFRLEETRRMGVIIPEQMLKSYIKITEDPLD